MEKKKIMFDCNVFDKVILDDNTIDLLPIIWGCSSAGRARASHVRGQGFDPPHLHQKKARLGVLFSTKYALRRVKYCSAMLNSNALKYLLRKC